MQNRAPLYRTLIVISPTYCWADDSSTPTSQLVAIIIALAAIAYGLRLAWQQRGPSEHAASERPVRTGRITTHELDVDDDPFAAADRAATAASPSSKPITQTGTLRRTKAILARNAAKQASTGAITRPVTRPVKADNDTPDTNDPPTRITFTH
ncbi:MAG: hypothetical protein ACYTF0_00045 [Planctomycetota bacterium]|jgi:hypothetical protein